MTEDDTESASTADHQIANADEPKRRNRRAGGMYFTPESDKDSPKVMLAKKVNRLMLERGLTRAQVTAELNRVRSPNTPEYGRHRMHIILTAKHLPEQALLEDLAKVFKIEVTDLIPATARLIDKVAAPPEALPRFEQLPDGKLRLHLNGVVVSDATGHAILTLLRADAQRQ